MTAKIVNLPWGFVKKKQICWVNRIESKAWFLSRSTHVNVTFIDIPY